MTRPSVWVFTALTATALILSMILTYSFLRFGHNPANVMALDPLDTMTIQVECVTGSMEPGITCLDTLTVAGPQVEGIRVGTIIVVPLCVNPDPDAAVVHRVVEMQGTMYRTRGDNNDYIDECWTPFDSVYGYVTHVEKSDSSEGMAILVEIWAMEAERDMLERAMIERMDLLYEKLNLVYTTTDADEKLAYALEHDALVPTYNRWLDEYDTSIVEIKSLREQLQDVRDGE
jgi:signal peptidase I